MKLTLVLFHQKPEQIVISFLLVPHFSQKTRHTDANNVIEIPLRFRIRLYSVFYLPINMYHVSITIPLSNDIQKPCQLSVMLFLFLYAQTPHFCFLHHLQELKKL